MAVGIMKAPDAVSARLAECYVTIEGKRYNFAQAINLEARGEKTKVEVPILGQTAYGNKSAGIKYSGSATFHFNTSVFRKLMLKYQETGEDIYFDIQITNSDPTSKAGSQTIILEDCNMDGALIASFDADGDYLEDDFDFTFERFKMPEEFTQLSVM